MDRILESEYFKIKNELNQEQADNRKLTTEVSELKAKIKGMKPTKSAEQITALKETIEEMGKLIHQLHSKIYELEQEKKKILESKHMVSNAEYEGLLKQLERERQSKEQYQRLYQQEKTKRNELKKGFKTENENSVENDNLSIRIKELEAKLSRKGTGKPRNNNTSDEDVLKLRNEGKVIREICSITGMSTATVVKILKRSGAGTP